MKRRMRICIGKAVSHAASETRCQRRLDDLARYMSSWVGYFGLARQFEDIANHDGWLKRRIRMCY